MKILFTCSRTGTKIGKYRNFDLEVLKELNRQKVRVESTFEKSYLDSAPKLKRILNLSVNESDYKYVHDERIRMAIRESDGFVIEASYPSFRLGFEAFYALSCQKPVLVLSKFRNFANLIDQPHFFGAKYTDFTLPDDIENFLKHVKIYKLGTRFNLFISTEHKRKIEEMSKRFNISKSDYIRGLIDKNAS